MNDLWRTLMIDDRVRVIEWPAELREDELAPETRDLYRWLVETGAVLKIVKIDEFGLPQGEVSRVVNGERQWEFLLLNHSGLQTVARTESD